VFKISDDNWSTVIDVFDPSPPAPRILSPSPFVLLQIGDFVEVDKIVGIVAGQVFPCRRVGLPFRLLIRRHT